MRPNLNSKAELDRKAELDSESRATDVVWNCFDPEAEVGIIERDRPHWDQAGAVTFVTMRLVDSMPKAVVERWLVDQKAWTAEQGLANTDIDTFLLQSNVPRKLKRAFTKFRNEKWNEGLDRCHGACLLRSPENAKIVADSFLHFEGERYDLDRFVVMPNHVHLLVQMHSGWKLRKQCESWTRFTGRAIHYSENSSGVCWAEPFDHVVRNVEQIEYLREYIADNPKKAMLAAGDYVLWIRENGFCKSSHDSPSREVRS